MSFVKEPNAEPIPGYRLIDRLGSGGFGEVWKCEAPGGLLKAVKFVFGDINSLDSDSAGARQEHSALKCVKEVRHPFVLSLERFEVIDGELVMVMELADKNLQEVFEECQAAGMVGIPRQDLLRYIKDAAEALDHMNQKYNLQHLDVKPRNLFLISNRVKVADFGLVKPVEADKSGGMLASVTPLYAPPETYTGKVSPNSDQYSLAIVYQEMLTGQRPFAGKNARQLMLQHTQAEPELRHLPESERPVIARALSKDPDKRFADCMSFVLALYTARMPLKTEVLIPAGGDAGGMRPKTVAQTMEDLLIEQMAEEAAGGSRVLEEVVETDKVSDLGMTAAAPQTGSLRPTLIVGVGGFSRRAIMELRCRFLDRFGDLHKLPLLRFLYIDPDSEALRLSVRGSPEVACSADEVFHLPLQPIGNYRRRMIEQLSEWLPQEKLYSMPRSLQTQGVRALGRLAYVDHQHRLLAKVKRELQTITHPDALYQSVSQTGLALRDTRPRVYVIASASGGSSGLLTDLGYGLRRVLQQLRHTDAEVTALLFCGAPDDPATPKHEQANAYATLTELNHFADPDIPFSAQYGGADGPRLTANGPPFDQAYVLRLSHRSPDAVRDAVAHLGSYLFHEITTPLGLRLEASRHQRGPSEALRFRSFGTYAVWFPRGLLVRLAARQACVRLLQEWREPEPPADVTSIDIACAKALDVPELGFDAVCKQIQESAASAFDGNLTGALTDLLTNLEEQSQQGVAQDNPGGWARQAVQRVQEWAGSGHGPRHESELQKSKLSRALGAAMQKLADQWNESLSKVAFSLMDRPGPRVAVAEAALERFRRFCVETAPANEARRDAQIDLTQAAADQLDQGLNNCLSGQGGGFSLFGGKSKRQLRTFVEQLTAFSRQCLQEALLAFGVRFYTTLRGRLEDRQRELAFCRQRMKNMQENLVAPVGEEDSPAGAFETEMTPIRSPLPSAESYWDAIRESETARLVLPNGETELERAAGNFLGGLREEEWQQLNTIIQEEVLTPLGGLFHICVTNSDLARFLGKPLLISLGSCLENMLPVTDVAEVELSAAVAANVQLPARIQEYFACAAPVVVGKSAAQQHSFLLIPASDAGTKFGEEAGRAVSDLELVKVAGQADLMFCREQGYLTPEELRPLLQSCRKAYDETVVQPNISPHARFDITDWVPLDP